MLRLLVTGSSGLVGSEVVRHFSRQGWKIYGIDNNLRMSFFGPPGDTSRNLAQLKSVCSNFSHFEFDIRDETRLRRCVSELRPDLIVHAAGQPSHEYSSAAPLADFRINAVATASLLEAVRVHSPHSIFVYMSTNKVYGDRPNQFPLRELPTRWEYCDPDFPGIDESLPIDQSKHTVFGVSKASGDLMVQEYGRYYGIRTCCLRLGCVTGAAHAGVELHGFLSHLAQTVMSGRPYRIFGYKGKQVRDNIHGRDVARFVEAFFLSPRVGEVYNLGGGRDNSCSILEAFSLVESASAKKSFSNYIDRPRNGDHICYISDLTKAREHYPDWQIRITLDEIFDQLVTHAEEFSSTG